MKFSRKLIFLATILIIVSIISIYFGSVKSTEGLGTIAPGSKAPSIAQCKSGLGDPVTKGATSGPVMCKDKSTAGTPATPTPATTSTDSSTITTAKAQCIATLASGGSCSA
jgi:hypothetical protein